MNLLSRLRVMPLLVVVAALSFGVRFGEFVTGVSSSPGSANAQSVVSEPAPDQMLEPASDDMAQNDIAPPQPNEDEPRTAPTSDDKEAGEKIDWKDSSDTDIEFSEVRMELFKDLSARRKDIQERERELAVREALLKAAEQEMDQKYKELVSLRSEIKDLLVEQTEEEKARTESLVKIYEGMKPKDAARIFNTLDLDVLLQVVSEMSERKSAPIIASMNPDRARTLTMMLMEQKSLPTLSEDLTQ
ncbi:MAG TPA: MotE family protein [Alphaproteobacteria bacterium]|nr:MotE family protein [Alphaproteobacteria bacterium]